jgi:hypothetical protein
MAHLGAEMFVSPPAEVWSSAPRTEKWVGQGGEFRRYHNRVEEVSWGGLHGHMNNR